MARINDGLSDRDQHILADLAVHGYLSTKHLEGLHFAGHTPVTAERLSRRVLHRLQQLGLVQPIHRRVGGIRAGSSATIWQLSRAGRRLIAVNGVAKRPHEPSPRLLAHSLAVADTRLVIARLPTTTPHIQSIDVQIESAAWRRYHGLGGDRRILQPDLAATLHGEDEQGDYHDYWFCEIDCGTESIPTLLKKCRQYDDYRLNGSEQTTLGVFPRVLWIMGGARRRERTDDLRRRLNLANYPGGMFLVTTPEELTATIGAAP
ncbi:replication-relaxation family protein [Flexivirga oryzae]|uniref:Replication-relaxation n=1 Tax=Flexivirga oryzae TaxID=1794944 RepID=A0A839N0Q5_9MICO|nr:replication-relaxation family protein [Flexivirga oryzae]MBB2890947.1 hypothetical protein [Flexivirga oryzae]